jgi:2,3-bisphosphoglycerate-dependent phosphoglycerate mutase
LLAKGSKVLVAAHGNSLRALIKVLEGLSGEEIVRRELATGVPIIYRLKPDLKIIDKQELAA